ncbi:MAG: 3-hydroxyacyl-CoA dehydrogenase family protein [Deltaproteobacteria bacterium]|nr:3-hydroxyacyl-CoA dehydrogenase family protein [Deltaproteobacteria bacterium]MBW2065286.1 3-hydroxyacyl-CoA dehydrogenase family protein [Deltaproteobacteria bacterium]
MKIQSVGIVGTGVIGASWAAFYASKGFVVKMYDIDPSLSQEGLRRAKDYVEVLRGQGLLPEDAYRNAIANMSIAKDLPGAVKEVQLVQESVAENYEVKHQVFKVMDAETTPDVIIASSSSGLLMTEIQKATRHPERCLIAHPFNPPHLIPLIELVPGEQTDENTVSKMKTFFEDLGKIPVVLKKEASGHIANRLAAALWREATDIVLKGIASVEDVDKALSAGPGIRWALMGQHLIYHLGGGEGGIEHFIDHLGPAFEQWWKNMATWTSLPPGAKDILVEGVNEELRGKSVGEMAQWRDDKLIKLLKLIHD